MGFINTLEKIFRGTTAGDTTGTPARTAGQMLNSNMDKIDSALAEIDTAAEKKANKVNNLDAPNATQYPTSQAVSNAVSGIQSAAESSTDFKLLAYQKTSEKGSANGYAPLDANAKVPPANTYAVMDEIIEGEYINATTFNDEFGNPVTPGSAKLYQDTSTGNPTSQQQFRWSGTQFSPIPSSPGTTDEVPEGATNQYFTADRVRAVVLTGYEVVTGFFVSATDNIVTAIGKLQGQINTLSNSIGNKLDKGTYTGDAGNLKTLIDGKETPLGAESKADAAYTAAVDYANNLNIGISDQAQVIDLGDILTDTIEDAFNDDALAASITITPGEYTVLQAIQNGKTREWLFVGKPDTYEGTSVLAIAADFFLGKEGEASGGVQSVTGTAVDNSDPLNPVVNIPESSIPKEHEINGVRNDNAAVTGTYNIDWNAYSLHNLTLTGATDFADVNLPSGTNVKVAEIRLTGNFAFTFPAYYDPIPGDTYDGTISNTIKVSVINGTSGSEKVEYQIINNPA